MGRRDMVVLEGILEAIDTGKPVQLSPTFLGLKTL
jgi:hypothetical protein